MRQAVITGVNGQDGQLLARSLLDRGYEVLGTGRSPRPLGVPGIEEERFHYQVLDVCDRDAVRELCIQNKPDEYYNLAAISEAGGQWDSAELTQAINGTAVLTILEALRQHSPRSRFCQASSCEMFGKSVEAPQNERTPLAPDTPYAIAKAQAHHAVKAYREYHEMFCCSAILFSHSCELRSEAFFLGKLARGVAEISGGRSSTILVRNIHACRDWGYAPDYVEAMRRMLASEVPSDYVVATGQRYSVEQACSMAFSHVNLDYRDHVRSIDEFPEELHLGFLGDSGRIREDLAWQPSVNLKTMLERMVDYHIDHIDVPNTERKGS